MELLKIAAEWFGGGKNTSIFNRLQRNGPDLISKAKNISWDILHMFQIRQEATYVRKDEVFIVPHFLTFDQDLAALMEICAMKGCLSERTFEFPMCFVSNHPIATILEAVGDDPKFIARYMSTEANGRRSAFCEKNDWPNLARIKDDLETKLASYQS